MQAGADGDQVTQVFGLRRHRGSDDPAILAGAAGWEQHAVIAQLVGGLGDLREIRQVDRAAALRGAEIAAVAMGGQEPEDVGGLSWGDRHDSTLVKSGFFF